MERELPSMSKHDVYELFPAPKGCKDIGSMLVFKGEPGDIYKSRFCAQGFSQVTRTYVGNTCAPVCCIPRVRIVLPIAASRDWNVTQLDIQIAFRPRDISEVVCHNCKVKGRYANKCLASKPLPGDTTTKWYSLHKTRSHSDNACLAHQATS